VTVLLQSAQALLCFIMVERVGVPLEGEGLRFAGQQERLVQASHNLIREKSEEQMYLR
jgi:hypothetical protein